MAEFAEILCESYWAQGSSSLSGLLEEVERGSRLFAEDADVNEFVEMVRQASRIAVEE